MTRLLVALLALLVLSAAAPSLSGRPAPGSGDAATPAAHALLHELGADEAEAQRRRSRRDADDDDEDDDLAGTDEGGGGGLIALLVAAAVIVLVVVLLMRRRGSRP